MIRRLLTPWLVIIGLNFLLAACQNSLPTPEPAPPESIKLIYYDWEDDIPADVLEEFTARTGIQVVYESYSSDIIVEQDLLDGNGIYDVVVVDNDSIPILVENNLLHELVYENIPNFRYISINFRDLVYDPGNQYSVPFNWGSTGLIWLSDEALPPITSWSDLWTYSENLRIGIRKDDPFDSFAMAKKMLGYSINTCDPASMNEAYQALVALSPSIVQVDTDAGSGIDALQAGEVDLLIGWADDVFEARSRDLNVVYLLPDEGTFLWGDSYVIPNHSPHKREAEQLINFFLEPDIAARILAYNNYASANDQVIASLPTELAMDEIIFPTTSNLLNSEIFMPISEECSQKQLDLWEQFIGQLP